MQRHSIHPVLVNVDVLDIPGCVLMVDEPGFENAFITRVRSDDRPTGAVPAGRKGEYFVAFSRRCTHMGAHLLGARHKSLESIVEEQVVRCPAHLTCFDLLHGGLIVIGQACASLPQIEIRPLAAGKIELVRWLSMPYGEVDL